MFYCVEASLNMFEICYSSFYYFKHQGVTPLPWSVLQSSGGISYPVSSANVAERMFDQGVVMDSGARSAKVAVLVPEDCLAKGSLWTEESIL